MPTDVREGSALPPDSDCYRGYARASHTNRKSEGTARSELRLPEGQSPSAHQTAQPRRRSGVAFQQLLTLGPGSFRKN